MQEKPSVLIVDDERADLAGLERDLAPLGLRLLTLQDGHQLLDRVRAERPDLVLLDALLPGLSGFDLCKQIKTSAEGRNTLVVILTGVYVKDQYRQDAMRQFKADGFVTKPYRPPELHRLVLRLLAKKFRTTPAELRQMLREMSKAAPADEGELAPPAEKKGWLSRLFGRTRAAEPPPVASVGAVAPPPPPVVEEPAAATTPPEIGETVRTPILLGAGESPVAAEPPPTEEPMPVAPPAEGPGQVEESPGPVEGTEPSMAEASPREETPVTVSEPEPLPPPPPSEEPLLEAFAPIEPAPPPTGPAAESDEAVEAATTTEAELPPEPTVAEPVSEPAEASAAGMAEEEASAVPRSEESTPSEAPPPSVIDSSPAPVLVEAASMAREESAKLPAPSHQAEPAISEEIIQKLTEAQHAIFEDVFKPEPPPAAAVATAAPPPAPPAPVAAPATSGTPPTLPAPAPAAAPPRPFFVSVQPGLPIYREEAFFGELKREISRCRRAGKPITLLLIRVDDLGQIAELFGQESKNQVLQHVAELAVETARDVDMAGLLVSMELVGLTAFASDRYGGGRIAARILRAATRRPFVVADGFPPIIPALRFGVATFPTDTQDLEDLVFRAREELASSTPRKT